jgi:hypothetical protein
MAPAPIRRFCGVPGPAACHGKNRDLFNEIEQINQAWLRINELAFCWTHQLREDCAVKMGR